MKRLLHLLLGALAMLVGLELLLHVLPVSTSTRTDYRIHPDILNNPPHHRWTMATGWDLRDVQHLQANNFGFAAERDFQPNRNAVGLVGDSYVEAAMLAAQDRPAAQLERALGGQRPVYAMGGPGSSLLDYAVRIRWAHETLGLRDFVVLMESTDASQALCDSGNVHARCLDPKTLSPVVQHRPASSGWKELLRDSALAQYLVSQLKFSPARLSNRDFWRSGAPAESAVNTAATPPSRHGPPPLDARRQQVIDKAVQVFMDDIRPLEGLHVVFVIDMNRRNLDAGVQGPDESYHVSQLLRAGGYRVVQGEPLYREHLRHSPLRLEMGPHDGHLNAIGIQLLMQAAAGALQEMTIQASN